MVLCIFLYRGLLSGALPKQKNAPAARWEYGRGIQGESMVFYEAAAYSAAG
jgi:hypothetical protein